MRVIRFNDALRLATEIAHAPEVPSDPAVRIIRDIYGKIRFAIDLQKESYPKPAHAFLEQNAKERLGAFASPNNVVFRDDFFDPNALFEYEDWHETLISVNEEKNDVPRETVIGLLDRQIIGQDWSSTSKSHEEGKSPLRIVFYGLKGGVGRSTALAMLAYHLACADKRVLLLDFDFESPGLSGLLLPPDRVATYGLADWFVEDMVDQGDSVLDDILADSPFIERTKSEKGTIRVAAAMGRDETAYLAKLARVYADKPREGAPERFATRMRRLVQELEKREQPDVVLIDSRAGLHDIAAISIVELADIALLFASDNEQTWQGYRQLFEHWRRQPDVAKSVRERLAIVRALFPESEREHVFRKFLERSYSLFGETLYDAVEPDTKESSEMFTFDLESEEAPHFPLYVRWSAQFQEYNALLPVEQGGIGDEDIRLAFGPFFEAVVSRFLGDQ